MQPLSPSSLTGGKRKLSKWNKFVKKVYADEHRKNKNFQFKDALKKASTMKKKGHYGGNGAGAILGSPINETSMSVPVDVPVTAPTSGSAPTSAPVESSAPVVKTGGRRKTRKNRKSRKSRH